MNVKVQCAYCIRNRQHGGECNGKQDLKSCTLFKQDPRGCIRNENISIKIPVLHTIPPLKFWWKGWEINGIDTEIKLNHILGLGWDKDNVNLVIYANIDYYINDFQTKDYKSLFKVIEGGT